MQVPTPANLLTVFNLQSAEFAELSEATSEQLPEPHRQLLVHSDHMTVAMEAHHGCAVDVTVLQVNEQFPIYTREILLRRQSDNKIVQYGIARLNLDCFPEHVRREVLAQQVPLGRVLIANGLFRHVELGSLWEVKTRAEFRSRCETEATVTYGRTALIHLNGVPAIELLEIVIEPEIVI